MSKDVFADLERRCSSEARLIVHDPDLWEEYLMEAEATYKARSAKFPDTGRALIEYAPSFEQRYGADLRERPEAVEGAVTRIDIHIFKDGKNVAQFVNFYARRDFAGTTIQTCVGNFPDLYSLGAKTNEQ
ncbi:hypothetical protein ACXYN8_11635 [Altererythrobacter sp. CAU 1778]